MRKDRARCIRADVAGDAGQEVGAGAGVHADLQLTSRRADRSVRGQRERRGSERNGIDPQDQVMHDRIADEGDLEDVGRVHARLLGQSCDQ